MMLTAVFFSYFWTASSFGQSAEPMSKSADAGRIVDANQLFIEATDAYRRKDFAGAAERYLRIIDAGTKWPTVPYNAACCFARLARSDEAFKYLELAVQMGWSDAEHIKGDSDFESIHSDKRWDEIVRLCEGQQEKSRESIANPELYAELMKRMKTDQDARLAKPPNVIQMTLIDRDNTAWMKNVIEKHGWPGYAMVGREGAQAAWLLVQHADRDPDFQRRCLELLKQAHKKEDASADHVAYLTDRVLVAEGKPQVYGTQFHAVNGKQQPFPIENEAEVDQRRAAMGLEPIAVYAEQIRSQYGP